MKETKLGDFEETLLLLVGILDKEAYAFRIAEEFESQTQRAVSIGAVHSTLNRLGEKGFLIAQSVKSHLSKISHFKTILSKISFNSDESLNDIKLSLNEDEYKNKSVILIDDVLHSGRTLMYASKPFLNSTLKKMAIMVLVNRDHNSYPIKAKYVGLSLSTTLKEYIRVDLSNKNSGVYLS